MSVATDKKFKAHQSKYFNLVSPKELYDFYVYQRMTFQQIATHFNIYQQAVGRLLNYYQIPKRSRTEATEKIVRIMGDKNKGKRNSPETEFKNGHKHNPEVEEKRRRNISVSKKGKPGFIPTEETRTKLSNALKGEKSWRWKGGITPQSIQRIKTRIWKKISKEIKERDNYICQNCGQKGLIVHHIEPYRINQNNNHDNLVTLCYRCHGIIEHKIGVRYAQ